jgi:hypothetical protein
MKTARVHKSFLTIALVFGSFFDVHGHGFGSSTLVRVSGAWEDIEQLYQNPLKREQWVTSYRLDYNGYAKQRIKAATHGRTNCYFKLSFDENHNDDILCTPSQEFYDPEKKHWIPAYKLKIGIQLLSKGKILKPLTHVEFVNKPLKIYAIAVEKSHNYLVGRHSILTHNTALPAVCLGLSMAFGEGAIAGGTAGAYFGPVTFTFGIVLGGLVCVGIKMLADRNRPAEPYFKYDGQDITNFIKNNNNEVDNTEIPGTGTKESRATAAAGGSPDPEDPYDPWKKNKGGNPSSYSNKIESLSNKIQGWLGSNSRLIRNKAGDLIFLSADGIRRVRFDINNPKPHASPHGHVEEFLNGIWQKSGPIYPNDVPHR